MHKTLFAVAIVLTAGSFDTAAQRKAGGAVTFAVAVADPAGRPLSGVLVSVEGPATRSARTEGGRIAFEGLAPGSYRLRFEREGFVTLERELAARGVKPIDVTVTLKPVPAPPPQPVAPIEPAIDAKPAAFDVPAVIEREFIGREPSRTTALTCGAGGTASLIQLKDTLADHLHAAADEFIYVVAGEGTASVRGQEHKLHAGVLLFVPRGVSHALTPRGRNPLIVTSTRAGEPCGA